MYHPLSAERGYCTSCVPSIIWSKVIGNTPSIVSNVMALVRAVGLLKKRYEPKPRNYHYSGAVAGQCVVFAGLTVDFTKTKEELLSTVEVFDQYLEEWKALRTTGSLPKGLGVGGCCVSPSGQLYVYRGYDGSRHCGGLYMLSSLEWRQLSSESGKRASSRFGSRCCPQVLLRRRRFYSKRLFFGALASEAVRQLSSFSG